MAQKQYSALEQHVISLFPIGKKIKYNNSDYVVVKCDKPRPQGSGECKTDVYIQITSQVDESKEEIKISCKLPSNEFQENKINATRAEELFGENWCNIISKSTNAIADRFKQLDVIYPNGYGRTKEGLLTIGWKLEIASKERTLSAPLLLTNDEIRDSIYRGVNQLLAKKNSMVNEEIINDSGIANHMLVTDISSLVSYQDVLLNMVEISKYSIGKHYLIFTGFSYRIKKYKDDGNRPLAVQVIYKADTQNDCLTHTINFSNPLDANYSGRPMVDKAKIELNKLSQTYRNQFI